MKISFLIIGLCFLSTLNFAQHSESLIPSGAVSVVSINNVDLLQQISLDELVTYEFMEEIQQELFDGSITGQTLKDAGIDFDQRINFFNGKNTEYEISGFSFGVKNRDQLFQIFDDFQPEESTVNNVDFYGSYFNHIAVKGNSAVLFRISPQSFEIDAITDSIWEARGNQYPWYEEELFMDYVDSTESVEFFEEMETTENTVSPIESIEHQEAEENPNEKTYFELRDSVEAEVQSDYFNQLVTELFANGHNLIQADARFANQVSHSTSAIFYLDNARNINRKSSLWSTFGSAFSEELESLYEGNTVLGDLILSDNEVRLSMSTNYGTELGEIYQELTDIKFDASVLDYIRSDQEAYFTYSIDLRKAYEKTLDVIRPLLDINQRQATASLIAIELFDEFINKDALFGTYQGSMFGTFGGIQKMKTEKIVFDYDEETFEYTERTEEAEEDIPIFTLGFSTKRSDIPERFIQRLTRVIPNISNQGNYWQVEKALLDAAPLYILIKDDLFILTNDLDLVQNHPDGFGKNSLSKKQGKRIRKGGPSYARIDLQQMVETIPRELFSDKDNTLIDVVRGKTGLIEMTSDSYKDDQLSFDVVYTFDETVNNTGTYILDIINSLYVLSK